MHGTGTKSFHLRNTKIKTVAFSEVYAVGELVGNETSSLTGWLKAADLDKAGLSEFGDLPDPGGWLSKFRELENKAVAKPKNLIFFSSGHFLSSAKFLSSGHFSSSANRSKIHFAA